MTKRRRVIALGLTLFVAANILLAFVSTSWHSQTNPPTGVAPQNVSYTCGALVGGGSVRGPASTAYPVVGTPCGTRSQDQIMVGADIILGLIGLAIVLRWGREPRDEAVSYTPNLSNPAV